ncbi:MAG: F-box protein [Gammaproteobacteria bacterium]
MGNYISCISHSSVNAPVANHTIPSRASAPAELPLEIWREIAAAASAHSVVTLRQVSRDMRSAVDSLDQANLNQINQDTHYQHCKSFLRIVMMLTFDGAWRATPA